jgi:hypothetical protein
MDELLKMPRAASPFELEQPLNFVDLTTDRTIIVHAVLRARRPRSLSEGGTHDLRPRMFLRVFCRSFAFTGSRLRRRITR